MFFKESSVAALSVASLLLVGCGGSDSTPSNQTSTPNDNNAPVTSSTVFDGTWLEACSADDLDDPDTTYESATYTVSAGTMTDRTLSFTDSTCQTPDSPAETLLTFSLSFPGETTTTSVGTATNFDVTLESITFDGQPPTAEETIAIANEGLFETTYDIGIVIDDKWYRGDETDALDGTSADKRPTQVETDFVTRQSTVNAPTANASADFDGTWMQSCAVDDAEDPDSTYDVYIDTVSGSTLVSQNLVYTDSNCQTPDVPAEITSNFSLVYPGGTTVTALGVATHVNVTLQSVLIDGQAASTEVVENLSSEGLFNTEYDIVLVKDGKRYLGGNSETLDGSSAEKRPTLIDEADNVYTRQ